VDGGTKQQNCVKNFFIKTNNEGNVRGKVSLHFYIAKEESLRNLYNHIAIELHANSILYPAYYGCSNSISSVLNHTNGRNDYSNCYCFVPLTARWPCPSLRIFELWSQRVGRDPGGRFLVYLQTSLLHVLLPPRLNSNNNTSNTMISIVHHLQQSHMQEFTRVT